MKTDLHRAIAQIRNILNELESEAQRQRPLIESVVHLNHSPKTKDLLTRKEAAEYLGVGETTLAVWACNKRYDLPYVKIGRLVKYRVEHLNAFIERRSQER